MGEAEIIQLEGRRTLQAPQQKTRCKATTSSGNPCKNFAVTSSGFCRVHARDEASRARHPSGRDTQMETPPEPNDKETLGLEEFIKRRLSGDYPIDDFGYDEQLTREVLMPLVKPLYENYFRVRTFGVDRIPATGPALLVANHSGTVPLDAVMMQYAVGAEHKNRRLVRSVGADLVWKSPVVGHMARKTGNVVACDEDAYELLRRRRARRRVPRGVQGRGQGLEREVQASAVRARRLHRGRVAHPGADRPCRHRGRRRGLPDDRQREVAGQGARLPLLPDHADVPAVRAPRSGPAARRAGSSSSATPISVDDYPEDAADDPMTIFDLSDRIRDTIQQMLYSNLSKRGSAFF